MDPLASRLVNPVTEYSAKQGSSGFPNEHWSGMDAAILLSCYHDLRESSQATSDLRESSQATVDHHESNQGTADPRESNQNTP